MAKVVIKPSETDFNVTSEDTSLNVSSSDLEIKKIRQKVSSPHLISNDNRVLRVNMPALRGLPGEKGEKGDPGSIEGINDSSLAFFEAKNAPIRDIYYENDIINRIDFLNELEELIFFQSFVFEGDLLKQIVLNRVSDNKTFYKTLHYENDRLSKITIESAGE